MNEKKSSEAAKSLVTIMKDLPPVREKSFSEIYNMTGVDLSKYCENGSLPTVKSLFSFCYALGIDPAVLICMADRCMNRHFSIEQQTFLINNHKELASVLDVAIGVYISNREKSGLSSTQPV